MTKGKSQQNNAKNSWSAVLEDAEKKHAQGRAYVSRMRAIIRGIKRKIDDGEEFPGEKNEQKYDFS
jgi:hypothetical protein